MKKVLFLCNRYPNTLTPTRHVFVQKLVWALADKGVECTVIAPVPVNQYVGSFFKQPVEATERSPGGALIRLHFPRYFTYGQREIGSLSTSRLTVGAFHSVVKRTIANHGLKFDAVYGHFLVPAGIVASRVGREYGVPAFAAYGEATPRDPIVYGLSRLRNELQSLAGIVSVSTENKRVLEEIRAYDADRIKVFPNAIQVDRFHPRNKSESRKRMGVPPDAFHVAFVGQFNHRKGVMRVAEAVDGLPGVTVSFAGRGDQIPRCTNLLHAGPVLPVDMPFFLSAADVFVMPTLNEGCSNAIVEAMACGLPVVSSRLPFNFDILGDDNAILVDPHDVDAIRTSVLELKANAARRDEMSKATISRVSQLTLEIRAEGILNWMNEVAGGNPA